MKKFLAVLLIILIIFLFWILMPKFLISKNLISSQITITTTPSPTIQDATQTPTPSLTKPSPTLIKKSKTLIENVPFSSQAPFAQWKDERFQDGCEEAAALLAVYWARGLSLDKQKAKEEILAISAYQTEKYQEFRDTSVKDTAQWIIKGYFNFSNFEIKENISLEDIKNELIMGNLIIVPTNGQTLGNPHFTSPGPERHNLVIRGFDDQKGIFITNDPGIKEGESCEYPQGVLFSSIRDYPTGYHVPISEVKKNMIVVKKA
jgi:hypothetical protein